MVIGCSVTSLHTKHNTDFCCRANWAVALKSLVQDTGELHFLVQGLSLMDWGGARCLCMNVRVTAVRRQHVGQTVNI